MVKAVKTLKARGNVPKSKARKAISVYSFIPRRLTEKLKVWEEWKGYIFSISAGSSSKQLMDGWVDRDKRTGGMDDTA